MIKFSSYGPVDTDIHFYAPRQSLINRTYNELTGEKLLKGGHYITDYEDQDAGVTVEIIFVATGS